MTPKEIELLGIIRKLAEENKQLEQTIEECFDLLVEGGNYSNFLTKELLTMSDRVRIMLKYLLFRAESAEREVKQLEKLIEKPE